MKALFPGVFIVMAMIAGILLGQGTQPVPAFEVASIKPSPPFSLDKMLSGQIHVGSIKGSQADFEFVSLPDLLAYSYRVKPYQISGPSWMRDGRTLWRLSVVDNPAPVPEKRIGDAKRSLNRALGDEGALHQE